MPEAFSHPAKMAYGLLSRILTHAQEQGWLTPESVILDPFGGIGSTGILGAYEGYQVVCVELELKFCDLAEQNFKLHDNAWSKFGNPRPVMIQGDSRRLVEVVQKADCIVSSPPFCDNLPTGKFSDEAIADLKAKGHGPARGSTMGAEYGSTPGQLGAMKAGDLIISSPPYQEQVIRKRDIGKSNQGATGGKHCFDEYGQTPGNLGNLKSGDLIISSPPYAESLKGDGTQNETAAESRAKRRTPGGSLGQSQRTQGYGSKQNLGNLKSGQVGCKSKRGFLDAPESETFWSAAKTIVEQCYQILRPGGHAIWVCKDFVRNKKRVPFSKDWSRLCESVGFKLIHWHKATLVKERTHKTLFGHTETKKTERKSFFRRLAESKGSPRIDEEDILCMARPNTAI